MLVIVLLNVVSFYVFYVSARWGQSEMARHLRMLSEVPVFLVASSVNVK